MHEIKLSYVTIRYEAPIVYFYYAEGSELGFPEIRELIGYAEKLSRGKPYVTFSDVRVNMNITEQGKKYLSDPENMKLFRGTAALVNNSMYSFAANFMNLFDKKSYPFKAFTDEAEAVEWLKTLLLE